MTELTEMKCYTVRKLEGTKLKALIYFELMDNNGTAGHWHFIAVDLVNEDGEEMIISDLNFGEWLFMGRVSIEVSRLSGELNK